MKSFIIQEGSSPEVQFVFIKSEGILLSQTVAALEMVQPGFIISSSPPSLRTSQGEREEHSRFESFPPFLPLLAPSY